MYICCPLDILYLRWFCGEKWMDSLQLIHVLEQLSDHHRHLLQLLLQLQYLQLGIEVQMLRETDRRGLPSSRSSVHLPTGLSHDGTFDGREGLDYTAGRLQDPAPI